ncbi:thioesterase-like superfamily-domain-containing protein [Aspergillus ambiguus]|uniref:thioesterase family protein n=1 Tax=Aspergillus ambiguus TaxID=176160 RepID=UPI003CCE3D28
MAAAGLNAAFEEAVRVTPEGSHRYSAHLHNDWCVGTVPHGGYSAALLYRLAVTHFAHTHPARYAEPATPISMQLVFLRRTGTGPATLLVEDTKLGARTSTIHVTLSQESEKHPGQTEAKITGYITVSPASAETGMTAESGWTLQPAALAGSRADGTVDLAALERTGRDGAWVRLAAPYAEFRRVTQQIELYGPDPARGRPTVVDQWALFQPGRSRTGRWTDTAVAFLVDMFPMALDGFDTMASAVEGDGAAATRKKPASKWYPTVTMNIDFKKRLPADGVKWLYSRVHTKRVVNGRTDLDVVVLDEAGDVVALSTQVGLVVSASRNVGKRELKM